MSFRLPTKHGKPFAGKLNWRMKIDCKYAIPLCNAHFGRVSVIENTGVINQDIEAPPRFKNVGIALSNLVCRRQIANAAMNFDCSSFLDFRS